MREALQGTVDIDVPAVELATSEVVTNALVHAEGDVTLTVVIDDEHTVRVEVADASPELPVVPHVAPDATSGRGMANVEAVADRWGVEMAPDGGKVVWFTVTAPAAGRDRRTLRW